MSTLNSQRLYEEAKALLINPNINSEASRISSMTDDGIFFTIKINDPSWNDSNSIDYRSAELILKMQDELLSIINNISSVVKHSRDDLEKNPQLAIKVSITEGCILFKTDISNFCSYVCDILDPKDDNQKIELAGALMALSSMQKGTEAWLKTNTLDKLVDYVPKDKQVDARKTVDVARSILLRSRKTITTIAKRLSPTGTVMINEDSNAIKKHDLSVLHRTTIEETHMPYHIDGLYPILGNKLPTKTIQIEINGKPRSVSILNIPSEQKEEIIDAVAEALSSQEDKTRPLQLQLTAIFKCGRLTKLQFDGIGAPRNDAKKPREVLDSLGPKMSLEQLKHPTKQEQGWLFPSLTGEIEDKNDS